MLPPAPVILSDIRLFMAHFLFLQRLCACGASVDKNGMPAVGNLFHTVFNVQATRYFEWQSRHFMFWAKASRLFLFVSSQLQHPVLSLTRTPRSQQAKQPGEHTRLLSADAEDHLMATVNTHLAPAWDMVLLPPPPPHLCSPACS
jgi:hypothetical protein